MMERYVSSRCTRCAPMGLAWLQTLSLGLHLGDLVHLMPTKNPWGVALRMMWSPPGHLMVHVFSLNMILHPPCVSGVTPTKLVLSEGKISQCLFW
jgi:hypothetical protein